VRPHELRTHRFVRSPWHRVRLVSPRAASSPCRRRLLPRFRQARGDQRAPFTGAHQLVDRRGDGGSRWNADGGFRRQHARLPQRSRSAPGHSASCGRFPGRHVQAGLQAGVAGRRRQAVARCPAARVQPGADRPVRGRPGRRADGRVLGAGRGGGSDAQPPTRIHAAHRRRRGRGRSSGPALERRTPSDLRRQRCHLV